MMSLKYIMERLFSTPVGKLLLTVTLFQPLKLEILTRSSITRSLKPPHISVNRRKKNLIPSIVKLSSWFDIRVFPLSHLIHENFNLHVGEYFFVITNHRRVTNFSQRVN